MYFAYGSNINLDQMAFRCPDSDVIGPATLDGYKLVFRYSGVATIEEAAGGKVEGLLWRITEDDEYELDQYEGYPRLYEKETITVTDRNGIDYEVMAYVMTDAYVRYPAIPSRYYYNAILEGYRENGLHPRSLELALREAYAEVKEIPRKGPRAEICQGRYKKYKWSKSGEKIER